MKKFNVGDWVELDDKYYKVGVFGDVDILFYEGYWDFEDNLNKYNKITEQWKIALLESGRKTLEFKPGDVIVTHQDLYLAEYHDHDEIVLLFEENLVIRFCPEEHSIEV